MSHPSQTPGPDPREQARAGQQYTGYGYGGQPINPETGQPLPPGYHPQYGYGTAPGQPRQEPSKKSNGLAIASLILGLVGIMLAWIPLIGYFALVIGLVGAVLGFVGIFKSHRAMSIAGVVLSLSAMAFSIVAFAMLADAVDDVTNDYNAAIAAPIEPEGEGYPLGGDEALQSEVEGNAGEDLPPTNDRGNIVKGIGELAGVGGLERGVDTAVWSIDSIETDIDCTEPYQSAQPEGHLTAVDLNLSTGPDWDVYTSGYGYISGGYFTFIDSQGITHSDLETIATYSCLSESATFNSGSLGAAQNYDGKIILDLPDTTGVLVFTPSWDVYNTSGWEYPVGP